ncbi:hypothetical protein AO715_14455 [Xanthomonas sp. Mitacek01]|nr:hypothetical protein AO715_14455 [Xanthomonas sp. Mitacek01]
MSEQLKIVYQSFKTSFIPVLKTYVSPLMPGYWRAMCRGWRAGGWREAIEQSEAYLRSIGGHTF